MVVQQARTLSIHARLYGRQVDMRRPTVRTIVATIRMSSAAAIAAGDAETSGAETYMETRCVCFVS